MTAVTVLSPRLVEEPGPGERARAAASVRRRFDRVLWQRIEVSDGSVSAVVAGTRHRRPRELRVGVAAALGLREAGVPTVGPRVGSAS